MKRTSFFIPQKAIFGGFPCQETVQALVDMGVRTFVDLTTPGERRITPYSTVHEYISYPIADGKIPYSWKSFACLLLRILERIQTQRPGELVFVHCKGGHGRSGMVVACLLILWHNRSLSVEEAIRRTTEYHAQRPEMKPKWRCVECPHNRGQKNFVYRFFEPLYSFRTVSKGITAGFSVYSPHPVHVPGLGNFPNADAAITAYRFRDSNRRIQTLLAPSAGGLLKPPFRSSASAEVAALPPPKDSDVLCVLRAKFQQYPELKETLMHSGFRPIYQLSRAGNYWNNDDSSDDESDANRMGELLQQLRDEFYRKENSLV